MSECNHDLANAKLVSRATWICPKCGKDCSMEYLFWYQAVHWEELEKSEKLLDDLTKQAQEIEK